MKWNQVTYRLRDCCALHAIGSDGGYARARPDPPRKSNGKFRILSVEEGAAFHLDLLCPTDCNTVFVNSPNGIPVEVEFGTEDHLCCDMFWFAAIEPGARNCCPEMRAEFYLNLDNLQGLAQLVQVSAPATRHIARISKLLPQIEVEHEEAVGIARVAEARRLATRLIDEGDGKREGQG